MESRFRFGNVLVACTIVVPLAAQESARRDPSTAPSTSGADAAVLIDSSVGYAPPDLSATATPEPTPVFGQIGQPAPAPPAPAHTGIKAMIKAIGRAVVNLPSRQNLFWVAVGAGLTGAARPFDTKTNATRAIRTDAIESIVCGWLSLVVVLGLPRTYSSRRVDRPGNIGRDRRIRAERSA
jgi:hypothetical protein